MSKQANSSQDIFFDLDGTLIDSLPGIVFSIQSALRSVGRVVTEEQVRPLIGPSIKRILEQIAGSSPPVDIDYLHGEFRKSYDSQGWAKTRLFPGVLETLASLKARGNRLFVFTNKPAHATATIVRQLQMGDYFEQVLSRDSRTPPYVSKTEMLRELMEQHGVHCNSAAVVGDSSEDLAAAREIGLPFYFLSCGYGSLTKEQLSGRVTAVNDFQQLLQLSIEAPR